MRDTTLGHNSKMLGLDYGIIYEDDALQQMLKMNMQNELSDRYLLDSNFIKSSNESAYPF